MFGILFIAFGSWIPIFNDVGICIVFVSFGAFDKSSERELTFLYGETNQNKNVFIQTFGGFDVFVDGKAILFKRAKAKELLAYLVNRRGCGVTTKEACAILFEDAPYGMAQKNYFQTIVKELKSALVQADVQDILQKSRNNIAVNPENFDCDYYRFIQGDIAAINQYCGDYMINYSWAEFSIEVFESESCSDPQKFDNQCGEDRDNLA